ncbi:MAG: RnfABCDGE type electron transport complex subunit D [Chitinophagaceae bacterium]|nr:RnfABCDGE type electron transport complex subunit D [Chitinophagaceae bacterium]
MDLPVITIAPERSAVIRKLDSFVYWFNSDARHYQLVFLTSFLCYGISMLQWEYEPVVFAAAFSTCFITQYLFIVFKTQDLHSLKSAMISALSLCLLLKTNDPLIMTLAGILSISGKFIFRWNGKHFFNPTNFGIITTILITGSAWISPGQWGSDGQLVFCIGLLGFTILLNVKRLDIAITFFSVFCILNFIRSVSVIGWTTDVFIHQFSSGTLLLFTFFMITDPVSTPSHQIARIIWGALVALLAFYLSAYQFVNGAPLWALFFLSPSTILFNKFFPHSKFSWS